MLLPALGRARRNAKSIQCLNHLRQLGMATFMYADDNKGKVPIQFPERASENLGQ